MSSASSSKDLPIVLISAVDAQAAELVISELTDGDETEALEGSAGRVWCLHNKYYTARVRLLPAPDTDPPHQQHAPEGHIIYLTEAECSTESSAASCLRRRAAAGGAAAVRLLLCDAADVSRPLAAAARDRQYEPIALREPPDPDETDEPAPWTRARDSLHAHRWPGLRRAPAARQPRDAGETDPAEAVEQAELFADALQVLSCARELPADERRARADALIDAFARALGLDDDLQLDAL